jgi:hypothetical protein
MLDGLTPDAFEPLLGSTFLLEADTPDGSIELTLVAVERHGLRGGPRSEPFSLVFSAPPGPSLPQRIRSLRHPSLGGLELFLVPIGPGPEGPVRYEAVFN